MKLNAVCWSLLVMTSLLTSSCYYDVEEELYPSGNCDTENMSFSQHIMPVFTQNCNICHATGVEQGDVILDSYDAVLPYVTNGKLIGSIQHANGFVAMPQGQPQLSACTIDKIAAWIADGALNN
ncbi:MAG: c-type cytochrome [Saprospiraceae bacterium]|nr:c-type cytochrome [Saprospiraceae bacterium]